CYRVLVPLIVGHMPLPPNLAWRVVQVAANTGAGCAIAYAGWLLTKRVSALYLSAILTQLAFIFAFSAMFPYVDTVLALCVALMAVAWLLDRAWLALALGTVGVFVRESAAIG